MYQLAGQIPTPILAEMLGLSPNPAVRWAPPRNKEVAAWANVTLGVDRLPHRSHSRCRSRAT
jgi:hypothetical protein